MKNSSTTRSPIGITPLLKLWPWLRPHRKLVYLGSAMIPVVAIIAMVQPLLLKKAIDDGILAGNWQITMFWASFCLLLSFSTYILGGVQTIATSIAVHRMIYSMRSSLMRHVLSLPAVWHDNQISGALATRATSDFDTLSESLNQGVLSSVIDILVLAGCIAGMFLLSSKLAVTALIILPIMTWLVIWFSKKLNTSMLASRRNLATLNGFTQEAITSLSAVKLLNAERGVSGRYQKLNQDYKNSQLDNVFYDALMFASIDGISSITLGIALFMAISWAGHENVFSAGLMVAFVQYIQQLFEPLKQLGTKMAMLQGAYTSIDRIFGLLDLTDKIGGQLPVTWKSEADVEFKNVSFTYKPKTSDVLTNINFRLPAGKSLAVIGRTGSGKSTIIKLLTKLYSGYRGIIMIGGQSIENILPEQVRDHLGIVPQDVVLFEGSIAFNISLGDNAITREQLEKATATVGASEFIRDLPGGLDFVVKENGSNLSQGQRQLIVFARALVKNPSLIILDEATSHIDPHSEALVQAATAKILAERTVIVIAHRLETIKKCDLILVLENGRIVEMGEPKQLLELGGRYQELLAFASSTQPTTEQF
ncbi:MAG: ABC transporter ATP-binding protein [bacterium]